MSARWIACALVVAWLGLPCFAHAGGVVAYSRLTNGYWQIWTYDVDAAAHRQLTRTPLDKREPVWSADGRVLFNTHNHQLYEVKPGKPEKPVYRRSWPAADAAWSPDASQVALTGMRTDVKDASAIWLLSDSGKTRRMLTRGLGLQTHPTWSPDGKWLAYIRSYGVKGSAIHRIARDGSSEDVLLQDAYHNVHPQWSPGGSHLVYATNRSGDYELVLRDLETGAERQLTDTPGLDLRPSWSPDGERIAFSTFRTGRLEIWTVTAEGSDAAPLFTVPDEVNDPAWR